MRERVIGGRVYLRIELDDIEPDDVVEYTAGDNSLGADQGCQVPHRRCHRVDGVRRGKNAAVRIVPHGEEQVGRLWHPTDRVIRAWRRRTEFKRRPKAKA